MSARARLSNYRVSPQKARLVADQIRGKGLEEALMIEIDREVVATAARHFPEVVGESATDPRAANWPPGVYESICSAEDFVAAWKVGQWNSARIRCVGAHPRITVWINGLEVCRFNGETCTLPAYDKDRVLKQLGPQGSIGLQVHGGKAWPKGAKWRWRNIRIREL